MSERHNFSLYTPYGLYLTKSLSQAKKFSNLTFKRLNGIENFILKVSQTHFSKDFYPKGGAYIFQGGNAPPRWGGAVKYPDGNRVKY